MTVLAGAWLMLRESTGTLSGATGVIATLLISLLIGLWVGAPSAEAEDPPFRERWLGVAIAIAMAGAFSTFWSLYEGLEITALGRVMGLLVLVAGPAYTAGMLLPVLLVWSDRLADPEEPEEGLGTVGALTAGLLGGAAAGLLLAGLILLPWLSPGPILLATSVLLLAPLVFPEPERSDASEQLLYEQPTPFGILRVTEVAFPGERQPERRLYLNEEQESGELVRSGAPTLAYIAAAEGWLTAVTPPGSVYLFLGGGAYTLPRRITERDPRAHATVVELNPEVTRIAYQFFGLRRDHGVESVHGDARAFLDRQTEARYDRIYIDVYTGEELLPYPLVTAEAFSAMLGHLRPGGLVALNLIGTTTGPESSRLWSVVQTMGEVFPAVALYWHLGPDYPERQNLLLAGSAAAGFAFPSRAGMFERWPEDEWPDATGTLVFRDLFPSSLPTIRTGEEVKR